MDEPTSPPLGMLVRAVELPTPKMYHLLTAQVVDISTERGIGHDFDGGVHGHFYTPASGALIN